MAKKTIISGIQSSGILTLGNYLGAIKNWVKMQDEYNCIFFIADLHSITVKQEPKVLNENIKKVLMQYLACGINADKNIIFMQSHVPCHAELGWVLNCSTYMGELSRMTQFKDKSSKQENINVGLFDYPVLMAADILLYNTDYVPVGEDQRQHLEITRNIAKRFNSLYKKEIFKIPEPYIMEVGAKIMSLQDPTKKMSKSDPNPNAFISLIDSREKIISKFKKSVTDSDNTIKFSVDKPGISNLLTIYSCISGKKISEIEKSFEGKGYGEFKLAVGNLVADELEPIRKKYEKLSSPEHSDYLKSVYSKGAKEATKIAEEKLKEVYNTIGLIGKD